MMRSFLLSTIFVMHFVASLFAGDLQDTPDVLPRKKLLQELLKGLPTQVERAKSAKLELEYWYGHPNLPVQQVPERQLVKTKDGKRVELIVIESTARSLPGTDFSMVLLLQEEKVVDWASCWTYNRAANQKPCIEDIDADGFLDVAFEYSEGYSGFDEKRTHSITGSNRKWLYAYTIEGDRLKSIFTNTEQDVKVAVRTETAKHPVTLVVKGIPEVLREYRMVECIVSLTNTSSTDLRIAPGHWFRMSADHAGMMSSWRPTEQRTILKPGETVSQNVSFFLDEAENGASITCSFVPENAK